MGTRGLPLFLVNRAAVAVGPKEPYREWARSLGDEPDPIEVPENQCCVYLIAEEELLTELDRWLEENYDVIFQHELDAWHRDPEGWPQNRTFEMFREWLQADIADMVVDLDDTELVSEDMTV
jgi:hypothetical protein